MVKSELLPEHAVVNTNAPFELDALQRDWIEGVSDGIFWKRTQARLKQIEAAISLTTEQGVLIAERDPVEFAASFFAAIYCRAPVILANPKWQQHEWAQLSRQVNPAIVFGEPKIFKRESAETNRLQPGTMLIPTGGSSGELKLAIHTWDTLAAACKGFLSFVGTEPIHSCCVLPLYHVSGLMQLMRAFISEGKIVFTSYKTIQNGKFPENATDTLYLSLVPTQLQRIIKHTVAVSWLRRLKAIFLGGAPMSAHLEEYVRDLRLPIVPTYGMTETAAMVAALPARDFLSGNSSAGYSLRHATIQVIGARGLPCLPREVGRIRIQADSLCLGYHGLSANFSKNGYLSTDEGYFDDEGCLHIVGRMDRIVISGGEKIDTLEVEAAFLEIDSVDQALVRGWSDPEWGEQLVAFYVPANDSDTVGILRKKLKETLVNYKVPREIVKVSQLPLTAQGKPDHALMEKLLKQNDVIG